jgi:hypothetical protein
MKVFHSGQNRRLREGRNDSDNCRKTNKIAGFHRSGYWMAGTPWKFRRELDLHTGVDGQPSFN